MYKFTIVAAVLLAFWMPVANAQATVPASSGETKNTTGSVSYSVGQPFYTTDEGPGGGVSKGVQQAYEITGTGLEEVQGLNLIMSVYPHPTADDLTLLIDNEELLFATPDLQLCDINGKLLKTMRVEGSHTKIAMNTYPPAVYFLKVTEKNRIVQVFKIVKNK